MKASVKPEAPMLSSSSRTKIGKKRRTRNRNAREERSSRATRRSSSLELSSHDHTTPIDCSVSEPTKAKYLCLSICGYRKPGMSEEDYRNHMVNVSAPMTKDLMVKYGVKRWTQIHNQSATRALMGQLFDPQMCNIADFDCFSQVVFESVEDYKRMKQDPWYKEHLIKDHENFADTKKSMMTIGWIEEFIRDGEAVDGFKIC